MKKTRVFLVFFTFILSLFVQPNFSQASQDTLKVDSIVIGTGEWQPYHSLTLKHFGVGNHIVQEAFRAVGIEVTFVFQPWKRILHTSTAGKFDAVSAWGGYENWIDTHYASDPLYSGTFVLWIRQGTTFNWKNPEELKGLKLGLLIGEIIPVKLQKAYDEGYLQVDYVATNEQNIKKLFFNRIDMLALNYAAGVDAINKTLSIAQRDKIVAHPDSLRVSFYRLLFNKKNKQKSIVLLERFNAGLHYLRMQGQIKKMLEASKRGEYQK
ncbi:MAG: transporter substrate-binding domain-containing protein [Pseudomonadales bacterium]|nr:transporter substrate-binding domain-containing protein [Pseudomonadales bacterium]NRA17516.1 ABC transporter substrate-binding protein [Oceanospirillaceae bacterium]